MPQAIILGCEGTALSAKERDFFRVADPFGFILFARNCESPEQIRRLVAELRDSVGRAEAPVLIDQEGGRVARLRPPQWRAAPAPAAFGALALREPEQAIEAARLNAEIMGAELLALGIDVDCTPLLDLRLAGADAVIGDRAFGETPELVAMLGRAVCDGMLAAGVMPVVKHLPGHGRAGVDSHLAVPRVETAHALLSREDFAAFHAVNDAPWGMTAHIVYTAIDAENPATTSPRVIAEVIRGEIGFDGVLLSDDLSMKALTGDLSERARASLAAGCDIALHCNGKLDEMEAVASGARALSDISVARIERAEALRRRSHHEMSAPGEAVARLDALLQTA